MWKNPLQTFAIGMTMAAGVSLSACDNPNQNTVEEAASGIGTEQVPEQEPVQASPTPDGDLDGATSDQGTSVSYDISAWGSEEVESLKIDDLDAIKATFGKVINTDENSLDYASNPASKYRFMKADAPYLDLIDSEKYLELGWYYANPTDSDEEKELSKAHAKKSYKLARQLMGDEGGKLLSDMLNGQIIKNKTIGGQKIELAKCEFYSCMLVLNKSSEQTEAS
ncbi:hypothetical protein [Psychrobacter sp. LV10R520-6]|uniref:hypothetical protein n=1 Tax=Psychrobacter sp. LV10R520-6 TaxID=1415574 RepID=UPI0024C9E4C0|nr:hypothetical protein [Psychrobacter sp. LV10R520-6]SNT71262.1 hypothetical protein SAMN04488491_2489 [Psychrobacter sp. LV10R520-6]